MGQRQKKIDCLLKNKKVSEHVMFGNNSSTGEERDLVHLCLKGKQTPCETLLCPPRLSEQEKGRVPEADTGSQMLEEK